MVCLLFLPFVFGAIIGGVLGHLLGWRSNSPGPLGLAGALGGALGGVLCWGLQVAVWGPLFKSWPKHPNELGMGDFVSPIPTLAFWGSMLGCGALTGALAILLCLAITRSSSQPEKRVDETQKHPSHADDLDKRAGSSDAPPQ